MGQILTRGFQWIKGGFNVGAGKWQIDGVPVMVSAADLNKSLGVAYGAVAAAAGNSQGTATVLTAKRTAVTGADGTKGVELPVATPGDTFHVINTDPSNVLKVYPSTGAQINALGANAAFALGPGREATLEATSATLLYVSGEEAATVTVADLNKLTGAGAVIASGTQATHQTVAAVTSSQASAINASSNDADGAKLADVQALEGKYNQAQADIVALRASMAEVMTELIAFKIQAAS